MIYVTFNMLKGVNSLVVSLKRIPPGIYSMSSRYCYVVLEAKLYPQVTRHKNHKHIYEDLHLIFRTSYCTIIYKLIF